MTPNALGLAASPGRFELDTLVEPSTTTIGVGQDVVFHGGQFVLGQFSPTQTVQGTLSNFGFDPTDLITLQDFPLLGESYSNGALSLNDGSSTIQLHFAGLPAIGHFVFSSSNGATDISWSDLAVRRSTFSG